METRIIKAVFGASKSIVAPKRYKHDYGQEIEFVGIDLPNVFEAHFSNNKAGQAKKQIGQDNIVTVPDEYFVSGADVFCWVMVHDEATDGRTMYTVRIPVMERPEPINAEPTPVQQDVIAQAITALNEAVAQTAEDVQAADASAQSASDSADRAESARDTTEGHAQQAQTSASNASASAQSAASSASASAQSATVSAQYASQASASATSASQSADTASTKASEASNSAQNASAKATEASGYASTASTKASESSQSASAASGYATAAGQAKTAAETAQGLAEQAQTDAESAKDDAESARDEAQQIVSGISGKVEQIDQNTADIASLEADKYKAYVTDMASGAVASFPDGADDIPLKSCIVHIEPVQAGSGDPSPENVRPITGWTGCEVQRTGKNLYPYESIPKYTYSWFSNYTFSGATHKVFLKANTDYVLSFETTDATQYVNIRVFDAFGALVENKDVFNARQGDYPLRYQSEKHCFSLTGFVTYKFVQIKSTADVWIDCVMAQSKEAGTSPMLELGSTPTPYEPYQGDTYPITFPSSAGTVYGAYVDVTGGELVVDRAQIASYNGETLPSTWISDRDVYSAGATPTTGAQVVYKLAEPITYQLTPTEIDSLLGTNNVFADTGDSTVEYRANTKLYISKKITEAVSALS